MRSRGRRACKGLKTGLKRRLVRWGALAVYAAVQVLLALQSLALYLVRVVLWAAWDLVCVPRATA